MKTGDHEVVDAWVNKWWPDNAKNAIKKHIPNYHRIVKFRTSTSNPYISKPIEDTFQLVINYNYEHNCYIVWNAAIQCHIHKGKKISLPIGTEGKKILDGMIAPGSIIPFYRRIGHGNSGQVELILFVGETAIENFCKEYKKLLKPDPQQIPQGKTCLYAVAGGEIEYIQREDDT